MIDTLFSLCREVFQLIGLPFMIIFAWRLMVSAKAPDLTASLLKPMFKSMIHWLKWLWKETWKISSKISRKLDKSAPAVLRPILAPVVQAMIWLLILGAGTKLLH